MERFARTLKLKLTKSTYGRTFRRREKIAENTCGSSDFVPDRGENSRTPVGMTEFAARNIVPTSRTRALQILAMVAG